MTTSSASAKTAQIRSGASWRFETGTASLWRARESCSLQIIGLPKRGAYLMSAGGRGVPAIAQV